MQHPIPQLKQYPKKKPRTSFEDIEMYNNLERAVRKRKKYNIGLLREHKIRKEEGRYDATHRSYILHKSKTPPLLLFLYGEGGANNQCALPTPTKPATSHHYTERVVK